MADLPKLFKHIEKHFYNYEAIRRAVALRQEEILKGSPSGGERIGTPSNQTGDPTGRKVEQMNDIKFVETGEGVFYSPIKWLAVFEATQRQFTGGEAELIKLRYVQKQPRTRIMIEIEIHEQTYHFWRRNILKSISTITRLYGAPWHYVRRKY